MTAGSATSPYRADPATAATFDRDYSEFLPFATRLGGCHLDPDFSHLTYGDGGASRGQRIRGHLGAGDFIAFWAGLRDVDAGAIVCSLIGLFTISTVLNVADIGPLDAHRNAHTRHNVADDAGDVVVFAHPARSGRLRRHLPIGRFRGRAQRVETELLRVWGGLENGDGGDWPDGYIQRAGAPPIFRNPDRFLNWFWARKPARVHANSV